LSLSLRRKGKSLMMEAMAWRRRGDKIQIELRMPKEKVNK
jgi:hypothetical protein